MSDGYDNTDRGAAFPPKDQLLILQGKMNNYGEDLNIALVKGTTRDGDPIIGIYQRVGALFPNDKGDNENRPDYTGPVNFNGGKKRYLSAWKKIKDNMPYMSINVSDPRSAARDDAPTGSGGDAGGNDLEDDGIPF